MSDTISLAEAIPAKMKEIREVYIPAYQECGPASAFAVAMMNASLTKAENALASGDPIEMLRVFDDLNQYKL